MTSFKFLTRTGNDRLKVVPSPSSPTLLLPQVQTVPSDLSATVWLPPPAKAVTIPMGDATGTLGLIPNWPQLLLPTENATFSAIAPGSSITQIKVRVVVSFICTLRSWPILREENIRRASDGSDPVYGRKRRFRTVAT